MGVRQECIRKKDKLRKKSIKATNLIIPMISAFI